MIAQYEAEQPDSSLISPQVYGFNQRHKHLPEMQAIPGLTLPPVFSPIVAPYYSGMLVLVPIHGAMAPCSASQAGAAGMPCNTLCRITGDAGYWMRKKLQRGKASSRLTP